MELDTQLQNWSQIRVLAYGPEKSKKTWWSLAAAKLGFNIIYIDSNSGYHIAKQIPPEARQRISYINTVDRLDRAVACVFLTHFLSGAPFLWDETVQRVVLVPQRRNKEHSFVRIDQSKLTRNDIVLIDAHTDNAVSLAQRWNQENKVDIAAKAAIVDRNWDGYRWAGMLVNKWMAQIKALPCHVIMIGHETEYEKSHEEVVNGKKTRIVDWTRTQIISSSGPNARGVPSEFSDILRFSISGVLGVRISTEPAPDKTGGCRHIAPGKFTWEDLQFGKLCEAAGITPPGKDAPLTEAVENIPPGAELPEDAQPTAEQQRKIISTPEKKKEVSLGGLFKSKK